MADVKLLRKAGDGCVGCVVCGMWQHRQCCRPGLLPRPATRPHHPSRHLATRDKTCAADTRRLARFSHTECSFLSWNGNLSIFHSLQKCFHHTIRMIILNNKVQCPSVRMYGYVTILVSLPMIRPWWSKGRPWWPKGRPWWSKGRPLFRNGPPLIDRRHQTALVIKRKALERRVKS